MTTGSEVAKMVLDKADVLKTREKNVNRDIRKAFDFIPAELQEQMRNGVTDLDKIDFFEGVATTARRSRERKKEKKEGLLERLRKADHKKSSYAI